MDTLMDLIMKRTFRYKDEVYIGKFFQTAGLFGLPKKQSKIHLKRLLKKGVLEQKRNNLILRW